MSVNGAKMPRLGSARLGSARLGSARLGSARLGSARQKYRTFYSVCQVLILSNRQVKSGNWVNYALFPDFSFVGRGRAAETLRLNVRCCGCFYMVLSIYLLRQQFLMI